MKRALSLARVVCLSSALMAAHGVVGAAQPFSPKAAAVKNNALTPEEISDGYELLWNGLDYSGWLLNNNRANPGDPTAAVNWTIINSKGLQSGDMHKSADPDSNMIEIVSSGASLFTADSTFGNFDWKVEWRGDTGLTIQSGLHYHFRIENSIDADVSASEYQIQNSRWTIDWKNFTAGCLYDMFPLQPARSNPDHSPNWLKADGEWNESRIVSYGGRTAHYGNGLRLLEYRKGTPEYDTAFNKSRYRAFPEHRTIHSGSFLLEDHGQPRTAFRNIRVKRLTEDPWGPGSPYVNTDSVAAGDTCLIDMLGSDRNLFPVTTSVLPARKGLLGKGRDVPRDALGRAAKDDGGMLPRFSPPLPKEK